MPSGSRSNRSRRATSASAPCRSASGRRCLPLVWLRSKADLVTPLPGRESGYETSRLCMAMPGHGAGCRRCARWLHGGTELQAARGHRAGGLAKQPGARRLARRSRLVGALQGSGPLRADRHRGGHQPRPPGRGGPGAGVTRPAGGRARCPVPPGQCRRQLPVHAPVLGEQSRLERLAEGALYGDDFQTSVDLTFELDLWGWLRRATEAARAELLASEENRRVVLMTLVSDVARTYFDLLELDRELEIARRTLQTREESCSSSAAVSSRGSPHSWTST